MNEELFTKYKITSLIASGYLVLWYIFDINISKIEIIKEIGINEEKPIVYVLISIIVFCSIEGMLEFSKVDKKAWQNKIQTLCLAIIPISSIVLTYPKIISNSVLNDSSRVDLIIPFTLSIIVAFLASILHYGITTSLVFYKLRKTLLPGQIFTKFLFSSLIIVSIYFNSFFINGYSEYAVLLRFLIFTFFFVVTFIILSPKEKLFTREKLIWLSKKSESLDRQVEVCEHSKTLRNPISMPNKKIHKKIMNHINKEGEYARKGIFPRFTMIKEFQFTQLDNKLIPSSEQLQDEDLAINVSFIEKSNGKIVHTEDIKFKYIKQACNELSSLPVGNDIRSFLTPMATKAYQLQKFNESDVNKLLFELSMHDDNLKELKSLVKTRNPDINHKNEDGWTALLIAVANGQENTAKFLLQKAADTSSSTKHGASPLHFACKYGILPLCKLLISYHAEIDQKDIDGSTPLMLAAQYGHGEIVQFLLENGADAKLTNFYDKSALDFATDSNYGEICRHIKKHLSNK